MADCSVIAVNKRLKRLDGSGKRLSTEAEKQGEACAQSSEEDEGSDQSVIGNGGKRPPIVKPVSVKNDGDEGREGD